MFALLHAPFESVTSISLLSDALRGRAVSDATGWLNLTHPEGDFEAFTPSRDDHVTYLRSRASSLELEAPPGARRDAAVGFSSYNWSSMSRLFSAAMRAGGGKASTVLFALRRCFLFSPDLVESIYIH